MKLIAALALALTLRGADATLRAHEKMPSLQGVRDTVVRGVGDA